MAQIVKRLIVRTRDSLGRTLGNRQSRAFFLFCTPWILGFLIFTAWPMLSSMYYSLTTYKISLEPKWVGLQNYKYLLIQDRNFNLALENTLTYSFVSVPLRVAIALLLAILVNQGQIRFLSFWRTVFYMPSILPAVASSYMFAWMFSYRNGPISAALRFFGTKPINFFTTDTALWLIILFGLWGFGPSMIIFLAALQGIPRSFYEAASIDGANALQRFRHVTLPGLSPVIFFLLTNGLIGSLQMFQIAWFMEAYALPSSRRVFLGTLVYSNAFGGTGVGTAGGMGYASAVAWIIFAMVMVITLINFWGARYWVHYEQI